MNVRREVTKSERTILVLIALPPQKRRTLDALAAICAKQGTTLVTPVARVVGRHMKFVLEDLIYLWDRKLVLRHSPRGKRATYQVAPGVAPLLRKAPLRPFRVMSGGGSRPDHAMGASILEAARELVIEREWPSYREVACMVGCSKTAVEHWSKLLKSAKLWPGVSRQVMDRNKGIGLRTFEARTAKQAERPSDPECRKEYVPKVYSTRNDAIRGHHT